MTDQTYTAIAVLMDRSGSMQQIRTDAEGALRGFLARQAELPGRCTVRLADFDTEFRTVYCSTPIADAPDYELVPRGMTALLDGIGRLVVEFGEELAGLPEPARPGTVIVIIQTDGEENSSREWDRTRLFALIDEQQRTYGWKFVFLGANQDAISTGADLGISAGASISYAATPTGMFAVADALSDWVACARVGADASFSDEDRTASMG